MNVCGSTQLNCNGHGTCVAEGITPKCSCTGTYSGSDCATDVCSGDPCRPGTCTKGDTGQRSCSCPDSYTGATCGTRVCPSPDPCNGGQCAVLPGAINLAPGTPFFKCTNCPLGFDPDTNCATQMTADCMLTETDGPNYCQNGATCLDQGSAYDRRFSCVCLGGFTGVYCQLAANVGTGNSNAAASGAGSGDGPPLAVILGIVGAVVFFGLMFLVVRNSTKKSELELQSQLSSMKYNYSAYGSKYGYGSSYGYGGSKYGGGSSSKYGSNYSSSASRSGRKGGSASRSPSKINESHYSSPSRAASGSKYRSHSRSSQSKIHKSGSRCKNRNEKKRKRKEKEQRVVARV